MSEITEQDERNRQSNNQPLKPGFQYFSTLIQHLKFNLHVNPSIDEFMFMYRQFMVELRQSSGIPPATVIMSDRCVYMCLLHVKDDISVKIISITYLQ